MIDYDCTYDKWYEGQVFTKNGKHNTFTEWYRTLEIDYVIRKFLTFKWQINLSYSSNIKMRDIENHPTCLED